MNDSGDGRAASRNQAGQALGEAVVVRMCHDLAGPVGALVNGIDLLASAEGDPAFQAEARELLRRSAKAMAARLALFRAAFGQATARTLGGDGAAAAVHEFLMQTGDASRRLELAEFPDAPGRPPAWWRFAMLLALLGAEALPLGGRIAVTADGDWPKLRIAGRRIAIAATARAALAGCPDGDPRAVAAQALALHAADLGLAVAVRETPAEWVVELIPAAA